MSADLVPPSPDLARRLLGIVPYAQRLRVGRLTPPVGLLAGQVRSLRELQLHLTPDQRSLPGVDPDRVAAWVQTALGDEELAGRVRELDAQTATYVDTCQRLLALVGARLEQAREIAGARWEAETPHQGGGS